MSPITFITMPTDVARAHQAGAPDAVRAEARAANIPW